MERSEWQALAGRWLADARVLLDARRWSAAYYAAGYAAECGLKACVLARVAAEPGLIFAERRFSERCWTHNLAELVKLAGLEGALAAYTGRGRRCQDNWKVVAEWAETARYETYTHHEAKRLYRAIAERPKGVLTWIRGRW